MTIHRIHPHPAAGGLAAVGIDHVRLAYAYLAGLDFDGYLSLLDDDMTVHCPQGPAVRGRGQVEALRRRQLQGRSMTCTVSEVFAADGTVVAVGRYAGDALHGRYVDAEFCELFTVASNGLLLSQKTFFQVDPSA